MAIASRLNSTTTRARSCHDFMFLNLDFGGDRADREALQRP
ncbi:MAG: hypothetical protein AAFX40_14495 [Cyanobacteria bacterium J06639_1]